MLNSLLNEIVKYVNSSPAFSNSWTINGIWFTCIFGSFFVLSSYCQMLRSHSLFGFNEVKKARIIVAERIKSRFFYILYFSIFGLIVSFLQFAIPYSVLEEDLSSQAVLKFITIIYSPVALTALLTHSASITRYEIESSIQEQSLDLMRVDAVVYFKNRSKLRGQLENFGFLQGHPYIGFKTYEGNSILLDAKETSVIFLQNGYGRKQSFRNSKFTEGPKTLRLNLSKQELFPNCKYYRESGFVIAKSTKLTTNSRFVIAAEQYIDIM